MNAPPSMICAKSLTVTAGEFRMARIDFSIPTGAYCVLMGRTGCGKTTLLESICGLKKPTGGTIEIAGRDASKLQPAQRGIGLVPQDGVLFRTMTVRAHLEFALRVRKWDKSQIAGRVNELSELLDLAALMDRTPLGLSGGEQQRVALGRAISFRPRILCLDEPLSSLDEDSRQELVGLLGRIHQTQGVTAVHITHNQAEADQLATMRLRIRDGQVIAENEAVNSFNGKPQAYASDHPAEADACG